MKLFEQRLLPLILFAFLIGCGNASAQIIDEVAQLQNSRSVSDGRLYRYLDSSDPGVRARTVIALANIQDTASIARLLPLLTDADPIVRRNCSFALGQIGGAQAAASLLARLPIEEDIRSREAVLEALGRCGTVKDLRSLIVAASSQPGMLQSAISLSVARFAIRKVKDSTATEYVAKLIGNNLTASWATYALMRIADSAAIARHLPALLKNLSNPAPAVRMWTATILASSADANVVDQLMVRAESDPDWRVKVNAVRALQKSPSEQTDQLLLKLIVGADEHVALTAFSVINAGGARYGSGAFLAGSTRILNDSASFSWRRRGEAAMLLARSLHEKSVQLLKTHLDSRPLFRAKLIEAMGEAKSEEALPVLLKELRGEHRQPVIAAIDAYRNFVDGKDSISQAKFCQQIVPLLERRDFSISSEVVASFEDTSIRKPVRFQHMPALVAYFEGLSSPADDDIAIELAGIFADLKVKSSIPAMERRVRDGDERLSHAAAMSLKAMTGRDYETTPAHSFAAVPFYKTEDIALLKRFRSALLTTTKGKIRLFFRPDAAPFTTLNFILLAQKHFYDHLIFHRVVPNFVIQGGDPDGTGLGGPGYAIRTETHPTAHFTEGGVGMASSGKDTEGSQFFITHCSTPHLDGRYTIFAYTADMKVVDEIQVGDEIISVELQDASAEL